MFERWWTIWRELWRSRPLVVRSSLTVREAASRLDADRTRFWSRFGAGWLPGAGPLVVRGSVSERRVRLEANRRAMNNAWRPALWARFVSVPGGCELVGAFRPNPIVQVFTALWLLFAASFIVRALADAPDSLVAVPLILLMLAFGVALTTFACRSGLLDEEALRDWIDERISDAG